MRNEYIKYAVVMVVAFLISMAALAAVGFYTDWKAGVLLAIALIANNNMINCNLKIHKMIDELKGADNG